MNPLKYKGISAIFTGTKKSSSYWANIWVKDHNHLFTNVCEKKDDIFKIPLDIPILPKGYSSNSKNVLFQKVEKNLKIFNELKSEIIEKYKKRWFALWLDKNDDLIIVDGFSSISVSSGAPCDAIISFGTHKNVIFKKEEIGDFGCSFISQDPISIEEKNCPEAPPPLPDSLDDFDSETDGEMPPLEEITS